MLLMLIILWGFAVTALICVYVLKESKSFLAKLIALFVLVLVLICGFSLLL